MKRKSKCSVLFAAVVSLASASSHAVVVPLESRLGGLAFYDPNLDITWLADANAGAGSAFDDIADGSITGTTADGKMTWQSAIDWAESLTVGGVSPGTWRLASMDVNGDTALVDCSTADEAACADNEYGFHWNQRGIKSTTPGPFSNLQAGSYWSETEVGPNLAYKLGFGGGGGTNSSSNKTTSEFYAWAVTNNDPFVVPVPAAVWLFGSGLIGLLGIARWRKVA